MRHPLLRALDPVPVRARSSLYDTALVDFAERLGASRSETVHWRRAALSLATMCVMLTGLLGALQAREVRPYVVTIEDVRVALAIGGDGGAMRP